MTKAPTLKPNSEMIEGFWTLPDEWKWIPLNKLAPRDSKTKRPADTPDKAIYYLGLEDVAQGQWSNVRHQKVLGREIQSSCIEFDESHVLYAKLRPYLNKVVVPDKSGFGSTEWIPLKPISTMLSRDYLAWFLRCPAFVSYTSRNVTGSRMPRVRMDVLSNAPIPIPFPDEPTRSLAIQHRIVERIKALLSEVRESRSLLEQMRRETNKIMDSALNEVFGHIRDGFNVTGIPKDQIKQLSNVAILQRGKFSHRPRNDPRFFGGSMPWIQIQNLPRNYSKYINEYRDTLNNTGIAISKIFLKGTLVLSIAATIGALGILSFDACFPDSLVGIAPNSSLIDEGFLYWQLIFIKEHLESIAPVATHKNINLEILQKINLWVPPSKEEQKLIDNYLDSVQLEVNEMLKLLDQDAHLLDLLEQSILERAFQGGL